MSRKRNQRSGPVPESSGVEPARSWADELENYAAIPAIREVPLAQLSVEDTLHVN